MRPDQHRSHVVVLSTADFASAVWTNKQHLSVRLAETNDVTYIESLGLRRPVLQLSDIRRAAARLWPRRRVVGIAEPVPDDLKVISPVVLPWHDNAFARWINHWLFALQVRGEIRSDSILWTFSPVTYGLERRVAATVYHSVDLLHEQPRIARRYVMAAEAHLLGEAAAVVASSTGVRDHLANRGRRDVRLWENVADVELIRAARRPRRRQVLFAGNLTPEKVDVGLLRDLADAGSRVVLAGPRSIDGVKESAVLDELIASGRVTYLGNLSRAAGGRHRGV